MESWEVSALPTRDGIPVTSPARSLLDLATTEEPRPSESPSNPNPR